MKIINPKPLSEVQLENNKQKEIPKNIEVLQFENAELWYQNMLLELKIDEEIAALWYEIMIGGM